MEIMKQVAKASKGDIYLSVVGPVRVGKSTFIKRFMELAVIPYIEDEDEKKRAIDELPQSGTGKMIMTVEPKFVPNIAARIKVEDEFYVNVRLVDCVGYVIEEAKGYQDEHGMRYIRTPWYNEPLPFDKAAHIGTKKVIQDHSTISMMITSDGTPTDFKRNCYVNVEKEMIEELKSTNIPFILIVNSKEPTSKSCIQLCNQLSSKYDIPVFPIDIVNMNVKDIQTLLQGCLYEYSVEQVRVDVPKWFGLLQIDNPIKQRIDEYLFTYLKSIHRLRDVLNLTNDLNDCEEIASCKLINLDTELFEATFKLRLKEKVYDDLLCSILNVNQIDKASMIQILSQLIESEKHYARYKDAINQVQTTGYGFALPKKQDFSLSKVQLVKIGNRYGIKLDATSSTIHMVRIDINHTFEPIIGNKQQAEQFIDYLNSQDNIYDCEIFGRKLEDLISEGYDLKLRTIPDSTCLKIHDILEKVVNKGKTNVIAIVL